LATLVSSRSAHYLDAFLLIHAFASSSEPYEAWYPAQTWARVLGLDESAGLGDGDGLESAKAQWSKVTGKLVELKLICRKRGAKNLMSYVLLNESGDGSEYTRPRERTTTDPGWFTVPHLYWTGDFYKTLDMPAKAMLLIAMSSKDEFELPLDRVKEWYGISKSTAKRGFQTLEDRGIIVWDQRWRPEPKSPTSWAEVRTYRLLSPWTLKERTDAMSARSGNVPVFVDGAGELPERVAEGGDSLDQFMDEIASSDASAKRDVAASPEGGPRPKERRAPADPSQLRE
jgi:hypothetical protein